MIDIVIVNVPYMFNTNPPMAPALLKSCVEEKGYSAVAYDLNIDFINSAMHTVSLISWMQKEDSFPEYSEWVAYKNWLTEQAQKILDYNPRWIGLSVFTKDSQLVTEDLMIALKDLDPNCKIVIGGQGADVLRGQWDCQWYELAWDSGICDSVILREGEKEIIKLLENNYTDVVFAPQLTIQELDEIPIPNFNDLDLSLYKYDNDENAITVPITASKGCVRDCTFCDVAKFWPKFRSRSGISVAKEMIALQENHGVKYFRFTDSLINGNVKEFRLMNKYLEENLQTPIKYRGQFICRPAKHMPEEDFRLMAAGGCYIVQIGMESGSERVRDHMRKKFTNADIDHSTLMLAKYGIKQHWFIFVGYPNEEEQDYQDTIDLIEKYAYLAKDGLLEIIPTGVFQMLPGTPITEDDMMHELGLDTEELAGLRTYQWTSSIYKENTFEVRAHRFLKLVDLCRKYKLVSNYEDLLSNHEKTIKMQLKLLSEKSYA